MPKGETGETNDDRMIWSYAEQKQLSTDPHSAEEQWGPADAAEVACELRRAPRRPVITLKWTVTANMILTWLCSDGNLRHLKKKTKQKKPFCCNSVNLFEMRVRKLEGNIKGYPRGNLPYLRTWTIFFFFFVSGIFLNSCPNVQNVCEWVCVCVWVDVKQNEGVCCSWRERRLVWTSPRCLWTIGLVLTWQHEC